MQFFWRVQFWKGSLVLKNIVRSNYSFGFEWLALGGIAINRWLSGISFEATAHGLI